MQVHKTLYQHSDMSTIEIVFRHFLSDYL